MPIIRDALTNDGAVVRVEVGVSSRHRRSLFATGQPVPQPGVLAALIDTGAQQTCLDGVAAARLRLPYVRGILPLNAPAFGGLSFNATYDIDLAVLHPSAGAAANLAVHDLTVADLALNALGIDMLLGRDILARCRFTLGGPRGQFWLSYR